MHTKNARENGEIKAGRDQEKISEEVVKAKA